MGLRCLLGHDFGAPEIERDREEDGDEMVVTVREVKVCGRCGEERVISENKEVTSIRTPTEVGLDDASEPDRTTGATPDGRDRPTADDASGGVETPGGDVLDEVEAAESDGTEAADEPNLDHPSSADEDDGIILEEEPDERQYGEWPDAGGEKEEPATTDERETEGEGDADDPDEEDATVGPDDGAELIDETVGGADDTGAVDGPAWPEQEGADDTGAVDGPAWPEQEGEDEGFTAGPADGESADVTFGGGLTPDLADAEDETVREPVDDAEYVGNDGTSEPADDELVRVEGGGRASTAPGVETEFYCPNCGLAAVAGDSSIRAGDICPDCHKGYIAERRPEE